MMDRETELHEQLRKLAERYRVEAEVITKELAEIINRKPRAPMYIDAATFKSSAPLMSLDDLIWGTEIGAKPKDKP